MSKYDYQVWFDELPNVFSFGETVEIAQANTREVIKFSSYGVPDAPNWVEEIFDIIVKFNKIRL